MTLTPYFDWWPTMHWWNEYAPAWLEAVATALAFIAAGVAAVYAVKVYERETKRDERLDDDRREIAREKHEAEQEKRREQASLVSAWVGESETQWRDGQGTPSDRVPPNTVQALFSAQCEPVAGLHR